MRDFLKVREVFSFKEYRDNLTNLINLNRNKDNIDEDIQI